MFLLYTFPFFATLGWIRNSVHNRILWDEIQGTMTNAKKVLLCDTQTRFFSTLTLLNRAIDVKATIEKFLEVCGDDAPASISQNDWSLIEIVVKTMSPFKVIAERLEKHQSASGVHVTRSIRNLLLITRMALPESEYNETIMHYAQQMGNDNPCLTLKDSILKNDNSAELFMFIRYLASGILF